MSTENNRARGRPPVDSELLRFRAERGVLNGIDAFAASEADHPPRPEAIRRLIRDRLAELGYLKETAGAE